MLRKIASRQLLLAVVAMLAVFGGLYLVTHRAPPQPTSPRSTVPRALNEAEDKGYARARTPRAFSFPADHGPHPTFRTEWWYFTGNLTDPQERPFGFELTFFRIALFTHACCFRIGLADPAALYGSFCPDRCGR